MKHIILLILTATILISCNKKDDGPQDPAPVVCGENQHQLPGGACVDNPVEPTPTPEPDQCPEHKPGVYVCYDWGDCDGLFATFEEAAEMALKMNASGCHKIDGVVTQSGFGPCSECHSIKADGIMPRPIPFRKFLEQRDIMWLDRTK